jgi:hypothetical protein
MHKITFSRRGIPELTPFQRGLDLPTKNEFESKEAAEKHLSSLWDGQKLRRENREGSWARYRCNAEPTLTAVIEAVP